MKKCLIALALLIGSYSQAATYTVTRVSGTTSLSSSDTVVLTTGQDYSVTLPSCNSTTDGEYHIIKNQGTDYEHTMSVVGSDSDTFESGTSIQFFIAGSQSDTLVCDGPNHDWLGVGYW